MAAQTGAMVNAVYCVNELELLTYYGTLLSQSRGVRSGS
jgi:hypothetical protein